MTAGDYVHLTKLSEGGSLRQGYTAEGTLITTPTVGEPLGLWREIRNGLEIDGFLRTSLITAIDKADNCWTIATESGSVYEVNA